MNCPKCDGKTEVFDSRPGPGPKKRPCTWRRRRCRECKSELTTYERLAEDDSAFKFQNQLIATQRKLSRFQKVHRALEELKAL